MPNPKSYENHLDESKPRWFAVRTRFKSEKLAHKQLLAQGVEVYLPIRNVIRIYSRKKRQIDLPLIHNFVFVNIVKKEYVKVLETEYTSGFLKFGQNLLSIPDFQIELIKRLLGENIDVEVVAKTTLLKGDSVEVIAGPLMGLQGNLVNIQGKDTVLVELINSGYTLQLSLDAQLLRKINPSVVAL